MFFLQGGIMMVLAWMVYQDFRFRGIYWWLFPLLLMLFVFDAVLRLSFIGTVMAAGSNVLFLAVQMLLLSGYVSLRKKRLTNIFKGYLGLGDLLFLLCLSFCFSFLNYILFYLLSLMLVIVLTLVFNGHSGGGQKKIPLAGYQALFFILLMGAGFLIKGFDLRSDTVLLNLLPYGN
jgi:hypothetical protein